MNRDFPFAGTATHVRLGLRRDRVRILSWALTLSILLIGIAASWDRLYPTAESRRELAATLALSPSLTAILGPLFDPLSTGGLTAWRSTAGYVLILSLVQSFAVVRHTRADEQVGRVELTGSGAAGSAARASAAFIIALVYGAAFAVLTIVGLRALGIPLGGSITMVGAILSAAAVSSGIAVLTAQVSHSSRGANGMAGGVIALFFVVSAVGNSSSDSALVWLTPFGWAEQVRAFADQRVLLIVLAVGFSLLLATVGILISAGRDIGSSLLAPRLSRAHAREYLASPLGLAWRVDRSWLTWWLIGSLLLGAIEGSILNSSLTAMTQNPSLLKLIEALGGTGNLASAFIVLMVGLFALAACGFAIATIGRLVSSQASGQAELELSAPMSRIRWASGHVTIAYIGAVSIIVIGSVGLGLVYGASIHDVATSLGHALGAGLITVPAVWLVTGICVLAVGYRPDWFFLGWVALGWCVIAGWFGAVLGLPDWLLKTSPFGHLPLWPSGPMSWTPVLILVGLSLLVLVAAGRGLVRRDVTT